MGWVTGIVVFLMVWWLTLFAVLPLGIEAEARTVEGQGAGAPRNPQLRRKFLITTAITTLIWLVIYVLIDVRIIDFYAAAEQMMVDDGFK